MHIHSERRRKVVDVLEVLVRYDQNVSGIVGQLVRTHEGGYNMIPVDYVGLNRKDVFVFYATRKQAEGTNVVIEGMGAHGF